MNKNDPISNALPETSAAAAALLIGDVFTLLCFLNNADIKPTGAHFLPPTALRHLARYLLVPETHLPQAINKLASVMPWRTERATQRIRFIHFLCQVSGLVSITGSHIKPTLQVGSWLAATEAQRERLLVQAFLKAEDPDPMTTSLWRAYHMPGWKFPLPGLALRQLLQCLRQPSLAAGMWLTFQQAANRMPIPLSDDDINDDPQSQPNGVLSELLLFLCWLGLIEQNEQMDFRLTDAGHHGPLGQIGRLSLANKSGTSKDKISNNPSPETFLINLVSPVVDPNGAIEFTARRGSPMPVLYELSHYADLLSVTPQRQYRLSRERVEHAFERGQSLTYLLTLFERALGTTLPSPVVAQLHAWQEDFNRVIVRRVLVIETRDADMLKTLTQSRGTRSCLGRTLGPRHAIIKEDQLDTLQHRLVWRGLKPRRAYQQSSPNGSPAISPRHKLNQAFDQPTLAHLYLSAQLCHLTMSHFRRSISKQCYVAWSTARNLRRFGNITLM